jgi:hypothetical protein
VGRPRGVGAVVGPGSVVPGEGGEKIEKKIGEKKNFKKLEFKKIPD